MNEIGPILYWSDLRTVLKGSKFNEFLIFFSQNIQTLNNFANLDDSANVALS